MREWGSRFRDEEIGFRVLGVGFREGLGFRVLGARSRDAGSWFGDEVRVQGLGLRDEGSRDPSKTRTLLWGLPHPPLHPTVGALCGGGPRPDFSR